MEAMGYSRAAHLAQMIFRSHHVVLDGFRLLFRALVDAFDVSDSQGAFMSPMLLEEVKP